MSGLEYTLKKIAGNLTHDKPKIKWHIDRNEVSDFTTEPFNDDLFKSVQEIDQLLDELDEFKGQEIDKLPKDKTDKLSSLITISIKKIEDLHRQNGVERNIK